MVFIQQATKFLRKGKRKSRNLGKSTPTKALTRCGDKIL